MIIGIGIGIPFSKGKIQRTIVKDTFTRADSNTSLGVSDSGHTWTALTGTWGILSGKGRVVSTSGARDFAVVDAGISDCSISAVLSTVALNIRIVGRCVDAVNNIFVTYDSTNFVLNLYKLVANSATLIGTASATTVNSGDTLRMDFLGSSIKVFLNGIEKISATDTTFQTATKFGLGGNATTSYRFDDFEVKTL